MALNKYMHPRNIYKNKKPDFKALAIKYPEFREVVSQTLTGNIFLDFKNADCLRALSLALLKDDFNLDVQLPPDHLIPTIPLRLNYILWLEDILGNSENIRGIDIGTGASCVYPLISCRQNKWKFLATEADVVNAEFAQTNVEKNGMTDDITVKKVDPSSILSDVLTEDTSDRYDFCMCNPPFFGSHLEAWGMHSSRSDDRPEPMSVNTPSDSESVVQGGEVNFVAHIIADSVKLKDRIRVYSSMVGKKASLPALRQLLQHYKIENYATTEFCQGRTMRWGIAWSFDSSVVFPKAPSKQIRKEEKSKARIFHVVPPSVCSEKYSVSNVTKKVKALLIQLQIHCKEEKGFASWWSVTMTAYENTWSHQRRKRREKLRQNVVDKKAKVEIADSATHKNNKSESSQQKDNNNELQHLKDDSESNLHKDNGSKSGDNDCDTKHEVKDSNSTQLNGDALGQPGNGSESTIQKDDNQTTSQSETSSSDLGHEKQNEEIMDTNCEKTSQLTSVSLTTREGINHNPTDNQTVTNKLSAEPESNNVTESVCSDNKVEIPSIASGQEKTSNAKVVSEKVGSGSIGVASSSGDAESYLMRCYLCVKRAGTDIQLEMRWMDGQNKEMMHQVMQYFKNHLK